MVQKNPKFEYCGGIDQDENTAEAKDKVEYPLIISDIPRFV